MPRLARPFALFVLVGLLSGVGSGNAEQPQQFEKWEQRMKDADRLLHDGSWKKARSKTTGLLLEMSRGLESEPEATRMLGLTSFFRSVAEFGLGNREDAEWDWHVAVALVPGLQDADLSTYGSAGQHLDTYRKVIAEESKVEKVLPPGSTTTEYSADALSRGDLPKGMKNPKVVHRGETRYSLTEYAACRRGKTTLSMTIDAEGRPSRPSLTASAGAVHDFLVFDVARRSRFEPAEIDGEPTAVNYDFTLNLGLPLCR